VPVVQDDRDIRRTAPTALTETGRSGAGPTPVRSDLVIATVDCLTPAVVRRDGNGAVGCFAMALDARHRRGSPIADAMLDR
jgi:hypothetical protein